MNILQGIDRFMERLALMGRLVSSGLLLLMAVLINVEVIGRYLLGFSTLIADEYSAYFFVGCTFLGFIYSFRRGHFLRVSLIVDRMKPRTQKIFHCWAAFLGFLLSAVATYEVAMLTRMSIQFGSVSIQPSATPLWIPQIIMPLGMGALALLFFNEVVQTIATLFKKEAAFQKGREI